MLFFPDLLEALEDLFSRLINKCKILFYCSAHTWKIGVLMRP